MSERNCLNCGHFRRAESDTAEAADYGECRRYPPALVVADEELMTMYPQVDAEADCGEWKASQ